MKMAQVLESVKIGVFGLAVAAVLLAQAESVHPTGVDDTSAIQAAVDAAPEGGSVVLGDGLFILTNEILIAKGVTVRSENGRDFTQIKQTAGTSTTMYRVFHLNDRNARVQGLAISNSGAAKLTGNDSGYLPGAGVYIDANGGWLEACIISNCNALTLGSVNIASADGVMSNCIVRANITTPNRGKNYTTTAGLQMSAGLATHCTIDKNESKKGNYGSCLGAGAYLSGGRLCHSFVTNNVISISSNTGSLGGGIYIKSAGAIVDNCLIAGNSTLKQGGGIYALGGAITNCTIVGNTAGLGAGGVHLGGSTTFYGCIVQDNTNGSGYSDISGSGVFVNCVTDGSVTLSDGYVPEFGSQAIDLCPVSDYAEDPAGVLDLAGNPRLTGDGVDAGAFEWQLPDFIASLEYNSESVLPPGGTFSFTSRVVCADLSLVRYGWSLDGGDAAWDSSPLHEVSGLSLGVHSLSLFTRYNGEDRGLAGTLQFLVTCPDVYVVDPALNPGHVAVYPYSTAQGAATNLLDAVACARNGTTVHVGPGVHKIAFPAELVGAVRLVSDAGRDQTVIRQTATGGTQNRCVYMNDADALLDGFTLTGASGDPYGIAACIGAAGGVIRNCIATNNATGSSGGTLAVLSSVGMISNCVVRFNRARSDNSAAGPVGLYMSGGLVVDCDFSCNTNANGFTYGKNNGIGAYLTGGRMTRCTICDNASTRSTNNGAGGSGAGVYLNGASAVMDNCLIARNYTVENRGAVAFRLAAATVLNCTIVDNRVASLATAGRMAGVFVPDAYAGKVANTLIQGNASVDGTVGECTTSQKLVYSHSLCATGLPGTGNVTNTAVFRAIGDYRLTSGSPGLRAGSVTGFEQYLVGGTDLAGKARTTTRGSVDIGCYQLGNGFMMLLR